ncbi:hypothetical protein [Roseobacter litoralis]|uniref:hypothetical protein n=1 Tax=Roseobacter litoralis TaxID=42443 RepID=UPI00249493AF|nr:hypothetical protein [Roseobacter litoralis]
MSDTENYHRDDAIREHSKYDGGLQILNSAAIESGILAVRTLVLVNGGAVVAMLAFLANFYDGSSGSELRGVLNSITLFGLGVFAGVLAAALSYFTNYSYACGVQGFDKTWEHPYIKETPEQKVWYRVGAYFHIAAVCAAIVSTSLFLAGILSLRSVMISNL